MQKYLNVEDLVSKCGIIKDLFISKYYAFPDLYFADTISYAPNVNVNIVGVGVGFTNKEAEIKATGELLERYSSVISPSCDMCFCSAEELKLMGRSCAKNDWLQFFSKEQLELKDFPFKEFNVSTKYWWTCLHNINNNELMWFPSEMVYMNPVIEQKLQYNISTGVASHITEIAAIENAILEVVERDAFMLMWKHKIMFPQILKESIHNQKL